MAIIIIIVMINIIIVIAIDNDNENNCIVVNFIGTMTAVDWIQQVGISTLHLNFSILFEIHEKGVWSLGL